MGLLVNFYSFRDNWALKQIKPRLCWMICKSKWQTCNMKQQGIIPTCDFAISGTSAVTVLQVFELISVFELVQPSLLSLLFQVTSQCPVYQTMFQRPLIMPCTSVLPFCLFFSATWGKLLHPLHTHHSHGVCDSLNCIWSCATAPAGGDPGSHSLFSKKIYDESIPERPPEHNKR